MRLAAASHGCSKSCQLRYGTHYMPCPSSSLSQTAHSLYLQHASPIFENALACASPTRLQTAPPASPCSSSGDTQAQKQCRASVKLPLPGTSKRQALLLLHYTAAFTLLLHARVLDQQPGPLGARGPGSNLPQVRLLSPVAAGGQHPGERMQVQSPEDWCCGMADAQECSRASPAGLPNPDARSGGPRG